MKRKPVGSDCAVLMVMAFGFGVLMAWALFYQWGSMPRGKDIDIAAWVQAIGSIAAIAVAVAVPTALWRRDERQKRIDRWLRARSHALGLMEINGNLRIMVLRAARMLAEPDSYEILGEISSRVKIPEAWKDRYKELEHLGEVGAHVQTAILATSRLSAILSEWEDYYGHGGVIFIDQGETYEEIKIDEPPSLEEALKAALRATSLMSAGFTALLDSDENHAASAKSLGL